MQNSKENSGFFGSLSEVKLDELRKMIIGLGTEDLRRLSVLINDPEAFSEEISDLLPNSIKLMLEKGKVSYDELIPVVETALKDSVKRNPHTLSDILFPVMLPAIRKAVADDIRNMINSLNTTLEHGFSPKRMGWRFKSLFSGVSYAEIVLSHAYIFRVKQVFLIHKETGLLLSSVSDGDDSVTKNDDMVTSMLSAIKDFVQDSFTVDDVNELDTIKVGQFNIWIEQGPVAIIAAIVDGDAPSGLRTLLKESIEKIHLKFSYNMEKFDGDTSIFEKTKPFLESCLISEQKEKKKKKPVLLIILLLLILGFASYQAYLSIVDYIKFNKLEKALKTTPGIVITDDHGLNGKTLFNGLRDPFAIDPFIVANTFDIDTSQVSFNLKPYISLDTEIILKRAYAKLSPPKNVNLRFTEGTLFISGDADEDWVNAVKINYIGIPGVTKLDISNLNSLVSRKVVYNACLSIEQYFFVFKYNIVELSEAQETKFNSLINEVNTVLDFNFAQDSVPVIIVIAHTSYEGNPEGNEKIAFDRAQQFINLMINAGIPMEVLVPKTDFIEDINEAFPVRSVSFKVIYSKPEDL